MLRMLLEPRTAGELKNENYENKMARVQVTICSHFSFSQLTVACSLFPLLVTSVFFSVVANLIT